MLVRKVLTYTAVQYLPPHAIPDCISSMESEEGNFYGSLENGEGILPTEWVVTDVCGECLVLTDEDFRNQFEEVSPAD